MTFKLDQQVRVYGYAVRQGGPTDGSQGFFNGVQMQIISIDTQYSCDTMVCRFFDLNEGTISDWHIHANQARAVK